MLTSRIWLVCVVVAAALTPPLRQGARTTRRQPELFDAVQNPHGKALRTKPEVMAPAGGWPQLKAAVHNGADAVYFGLSSFLS